MKIYLRGNPRTFAGMTLVTGQNQKTSADLALLAGDKGFRDAVESGLIRLPDGVALPDAAPKIDPPSRAKIEKPKPEVMPAVAPEESIPAA